MSNILLHLLSVPITLPYHISHPFLANQKPNLSGNESSTHLDISSDAIPSTSSDRVTVPTKGGVIVKGTCSLFLFLQLDIHRSFEMSIFRTWSSDCHNIVDCAEPDETESRSHGRHGHGRRTEEDEARMRKLSLLNYLYKNNQMHIHLSMNLFQFAKHRNWWSLKFRKGSERKILKSLIK